MSTAAPDVVRSSWHKPHPRRGGSGFTLIEVVIAIAIFASVGVVLFTTAGGFARSKKLLDDRRGLELLSEQVLSRLLTEGAMSFGGLEYRLISQPGGASTAAAVPPVFRGVAGKRGDDDHDVVTFIIERGGQFIADQQRPRGPVQVTYQLAEDPESATGFALTREELPLITPLAEAQKKRMVFPITNSIRSFRCRYFDQKKQQWGAAWGDNPDTASRLPDVIEFQITLVSPGGLEHSYTTAVRLRG